MAIPVATFGKNAEIGEKVKEKLLPEIEVVHVCLDGDTAVAELPALCSGDMSVVPSTGFGTNAQAASEAERKVPQAIFFGGGFDDADFERISAAVKAANPNIHFIKVQKRDVLAAGSFGPNPETIAKVFKKKLAAAQGA